MIKLIRVYRSFREDIYLMISGSLDDVVCALDKLFNIDEFSQSWSYFSNNGVSLRGSIIILSFHIGGGGDS